MGPVLLGEEAAHQIGDVGVGEEPDLSVVVGGVMNEGLSNQRCRLEQSLAQPQHSLTCSAVER